jgi:putative peptidoglycan lipid II flippase
VTERVTVPPRSPGSGPAAGPDRRWNGDVAEPTVSVDAPTQVSGPPVSYAPGATIGGRYRLVSLITSDQQGNKFWRAKDSVLPRDMAVTLLPSGEMSSGLASATVARTLRVGRLHHIGLPQTLDVGSEGGQSYVVGQWVDGATLTDLLSGGPLEPDVATSITAKIAEAVAEAHRNGIALGGINPSLIRVNFDGQVRISHVIAHGNATPDQDIQAVGALLYLMLTGTWPLTSRDSADAGLPPAPTRLGRELAADELRPAVPEALARLAERALHPDEPDGIHAVGAISALLRQPDATPSAASAPQPEPEVAAPTPAERRLIKERRIKLGIAGAMLTAFAALIIILVASLSKQLLVNVVGDTPLSTATTPSAGASTGASASPSTAASRPASSAPPKTSASPGTRPSSAAPSTSAALPPAAPVGITGASVYDPDGSGSKDNIGRAPRAFDGDPTTYWDTFDYNQQFPTLKPGLGLVLTLEKAVTVQSVVVTASPGTTVQIRSIAGPAPDGVRDVPVAQTKVLGQAAITVNTPVTIPVTGATPSQYVLVYLTQLSQNGNRFGSKLYEVTVNGA